MFASLATVRTTLESTIAAFDAATTTGTDALRAVEELGSIRRLVDALILDVSKRVDDTYAYRPSGAKDAATSIARALGVATSEAQRSLNLWHKLERRPLTAAAVRAGRLSTRQGEVIAAAAAKNPTEEAALIATAPQGMVALQDACLAARNAVETETARTRRQRSERTFRTWLDKHSGMLRGAFAVPPEIGGMIAALIDRQAQSKYRNASAESRGTIEQYAADVFTELMLEHNASTPAAERTPRHEESSVERTTSIPTTVKKPARRRVDANVHIVIDHAALVRGNALPGEKCEIPGVGPVNVQWVRSLLGEAFVTAVIGKGKDIRTIAHFGRTINAHLRTALIAGGRECDIEGCTVRHYLEIDHSEIDHAKQGPTAWWNLGWLCSKHHRLKSSGWKLGARAPNGKRKLVPPSAANTDLAA